MRWKIFNLENPCVSFRKCEGAGENFAGVIGSGLTGIFQTAAAYDAQKEENKIQRKWQEDMYNKYQSPAALMRQYREGGLNPFLMSEKGGQVGQIPIASQGGISPSPDYFDFKPDTFANLEYTAAVSGNQRSQTAMNYIQAINDAFIKGGYESGMKMVQQFIPMFDALGMDTHTVMTMTQSIAKSTAAKSVIDGITADWYKEHGKEQMSTNLEKINQEISESVGRLGLMSSQSDLNRQRIDESFSVIARNFAEAFKLKKEGDKYEVDASTARQIQRYVVSMYASESSIAGHNAQRDSAVFSSEQELLSWYESLNARENVLKAGMYDTRERGSKTKRAIDWGLDCLGKVFHVNVNGNQSFNWSDVKGAFNNSNVSTSNSVNDVWHHETVPSRNYGYFEPLK